MKLGRFSFEINLKKNILMIKIQIKSVFGKLIFEYEKENNTVRDTVLQAIKENADLREADLSEADLREADLREADLRGADLREADLSEADLREADLSEADLREADLSGADLREADLSEADLSGADLRGANIDFSVLHFSCKSRKPKTARKQRVQLCHHLLSWMKYADNLSSDEQEIFDSLKSYANEFHRTDVEKF